MYNFLHSNGSHLELRTETTSDPVVRRHAVTRIDGEVLSDTVFDPYTTPVVFDSRREECVQQGTIHLLSRGGVMSVAVNDLVVYPGCGGTTEEVNRDVLRVPLRGFSEAEDRLEAKALGILMSQSRMYMPPEFSPGLEPWMIDEEMRRVADDACYRAWRREMGAHFSRPSR